MIYQLEIKIFNFEQKVEKTFLFKLKYWNSFLKTKCIIKRDVHSIFRKEKKSLFIRSQDAKKNLDWVKMIQCALRWGQKICVPSRV